MKKEYVVLYGGITTEGKRQGEGSTVSLTEAEVADMDPAGKLLQAKDVWEAHQKGRKTTEAALADIEKAKAKEPAKK